MVKLIEQTVEEVCRQGCTHVRQVIVELESSNRTLLMDLPNEDDRQRVLAELKSIMAVYDESGGTCCPVVTDPVIRKASAG